MSKIHFFFLNTSKAAGLWMQGVWSPSGEAVLKKAVAFLVEWACFLSSVKIKSVLVLGLFVFDIFFFLEVDDSLLNEVVYFWHSCRLLACWLVDLIMTCIKSLDIDKCNWENSVIFQNKTFQTQINKIHIIQRKLTIPSMQPGTKWPTDWYLGLGTAAIEQEAAVPRLVPFTCLM